MKKKEIVLIFIFFFGIVSLFFNGIFRGLIPAPFDALTGMYFPWHDYKWGYQVGVPVKNPAISDAFAQYYPYRITVVDNLKNKILPLWNTNSFSGMPLLATWQSGALYPLTALMLLFGNLFGWTAIIFLQPLLSLLFMYLFLREIGLGRASSIFGSITFSFSGFMMIFLEYNSPSQAGIWLPLILFLAERHLKGNCQKYLLLLPLAIFFLLTAGNFQVSFYSLVIVILYTILRSKNLKSTFPLKILIYIFLGVGISAIQVIPTFELFKNSIREFDDNIVYYNYGLIPLKNLITYFVPDYFGNPTTYNFWGSLYHEQMGYFGIISIPFLFASFTNSKKFHYRFFLIALIISIVFSLDTAIGKIIYELNIPMLSTSYASRAVYVVNFSAAIMAAIGFNSFNKDKKLLTRKTLMVVIFLLGLGVITYLFARVSTDPKLIEKLQISIRNILFPLLMSAMLLISLLTIRNIKLLYASIILLLVVDLFRFGLKYNPFVPINLAYPTTPVIDFLKKNTGYYRVDRERTEVMPLNSWQSYNLMSPSGYEPLQLLSYANFLNVVNNNLPNNRVSRYAEIYAYNSPLVDLTGVKYFIVAKRLKDETIEENEGELKSEFEISKFTPVFEDKSIIILENTSVMPRVMLFDNYIMEKDYRKALVLLKSGFDFRNSVILDSKPISVNLSKSTEDSAQISSYYPNEVIVDVKSTGNSLLMLTDTYYPGWEVFVDHIKSNLLVADGIYRAVEIPPGVHQVRFLYNPLSFKIGVLLSTLSLMGSVIIFKFSGKSKNEK